MSDDDMVPKSDLIALKESHKTALGDLEKTHEEAITKLGDAHTSTVEGLNTQVRTGTEELGRARATVAELEEKVTNSNATGEEIKTVKGELKTAQKSLQDAQDSLAGNLRDRLIGEFSINEKALEGKSVSELTVIRDALSASRGPNSKDYVGSGGGGGGDKKTTGREKVKEGLEAGELKAT
ncbi:hypothetical protein LCGC14_0665110 [marine sediment metagenome]|uniref:Uncharacterized protein n=1 Tax=marine sediment metagenome TaxID=412755 RepID=A0A0F9RCK7_9ZZZZ